MTADEKALMQEMAAALTASNQTIKELVAKLPKDGIAGGMPTTEQTNAWPNVENNLGLITRASVAIAR
jgi:hypothetical protein